jgi:proline dehydrogenase
MSTLPEIKTAVSQLTPEDLAAFRAWFAEFDARAWDLQFEQDAASGRLDKLAEDALEDLREGRCTEL